jgi:hypothetical protein
MEVYERVGAWLGPGGGSCSNPRTCPHGLRHDTRANGPKGGDAAPWQILDVHLFQWFPSTQMEFGYETSAIGSSIKFTFQPYKERPKRTPYEVVASVASWPSHAVRNQRPKRVPLDLFPSLGHKWRGGLVKDVGNTWTWSPTNFFDPPYLPWVFNIIFYPNMYFWKWQ